MKPIQWRSYRGTLVAAVVGVLAIVAARFLDSQIQFVSGEGRQVSQFFAGAWIVGALLVLNALLAFAWIVAEGMGRQPPKGSRLIAFLVGAVVVGGWRWSNLPSPHPVGGLDASEVALNDSRVYLWYAQEGAFGGGTGRAVYVENRKTGERRKLPACGGYPGSQPVQSIRIARGMIECRWPDRIALVDEKGASRFVSWGGIDRPKVTPISADAVRACWLRDSPTVAVTCAAPIGQHPVTSVPHSGQPRIDWQPQEARYFTLDFKHGEPSVCIEVPARTTLRDGNEGPAVFVLEFRDPEAGRNFPPLWWVVDRDASCARLGEDVNGKHVYEWHPMTAPYFFESHGRPAFLLPTRNGVDPYYAPDPSSSQPSGQEERAQS